ncbi:PAS domain-containing sensor histidine kinase [Methanooceanicella nereidis]|nr:ATP-binding protein [Methanocella sp. CWC-04]
MGDERVNDVGINLLRFLLIVIQLVVLAAIVTLFMPTSYKNIIYGMLQVLLPTLCLLLTLKILFSSMDKNIKFIGLTLSIALSFWTFSNIMWELLPFLYKHDWAYLLGGFGWFGSYCLIALGLYRIKRSGQWYIKPSNDFYFTLFGFVMGIGVVSIILLNIEDSTRLLDVFILMLYIIADIIIICLSSKLIMSDVKNEIKYLFFTILVFFMINICGDILFEAKYLFSYKAGGFTDLIYTTAMLFMTASLIVYTTEDMKIKALKKINKKLKDTRVFMDDLIMQSPDAMCISDVEGNVILMNEPLERLFHIKKEEIIGKFNLFDHIIKKSDHGTEHLERLKRGEAFVMPYIIINSDIITGCDLHLSIKIFPTFSSDDQISSFVMVAEDISGKIKLENDLQNVYRSLMEEYDRRVDFMNIAAHELRTPLTPIIGYAEILKLEVEDERLKKYLDVIERNAKRQNNIVNRMLEQSRLDSGKIKAEKDIFSVEEMLKELIDNYRAFDRNIFYDSPAGLKLFSDPQKFNYVVDNLLSNAVKYSDPGTRIEIKVKNGGDSCLFSVKDEGAGIDEKLFNKIFERFYMAESDDYAEQENTGLGLAQVKAYVELLGGRIWVESKPGQGSTFFFTLPAGIGDVTE